MTFNIGSQVSGVINNVQGDQHITGGQHGTVISTEQAQHAARELRDRLHDASLDDATAARAHAQVAEIETAMHASRPDRHRAAKALERLTRLLIAAGSLSTATAALLGPIQTLAGWLETLGEPVLRLLPH